MKKNYYIITGTSRGIGEALARQLMNKDNVLICISRNYNPRLKVEARVKECKLVDICFDLADVHRLTETLQHALRIVHEEEVNEFVLINNAGTIYPIGPLGRDLAPEKMIRSMLVNFVAPSLISEYFMKFTSGWKAPRKIINLSTGAAQRPIHGWSSYCAGKAGLEMFAKCVNHEQQEEENPVKICSFSPGVVDTEMQDEIRDTPAEDFKELDRFIVYKNTGQLLKPDAVAEEIIALLADPDFGEPLLQRTKLENDRYPR